MKAIVTVKLRRNIKHNPLHKKSGICPISKILGREIWCTDVTGSHHSYIEEGFNQREIVKKAYAKFRHITRIELFDD